MTLLSSRLSTALSSSIKMVHKCIKVFSLGLYSIDSCRFMASNLDKLASYLGNDQFKRLREFYKEKEVFRLVRRRGYTHMSI